MKTLEILTALRVAGVGLRQAQAALNQLANDTKNIHAMASRSATTAAEDLEWRIEQIRDVHTGLMLDGTMSDSIKALGLDKA